MMLFPVHRQLPSYGKDITQSFPGAETLDICIHNV